MRARSSVADKFNSSYSQILRYPGSQTKLAESLVLGSKRTRRITGKAFRISLQPNCNWQIDNAVLTGQPWYTKGPAQNKDFGVNSHLGNERLDFRGLPACPVSNFPEKRLEIEPSSQTLLDGAIPPLRRRFTPMR